MAILSTTIHPTTYHDATAAILAWAGRGESRTVCLANVHVVMEAYDDPVYRAAVNGADLVAPDGMPLVWVLRRMGHSLKDRVYGPTLTLRVLEAAARQGLPVGFYGAVPEVLAALIANVRQQYPETSLQKVVIPLKKGIHAFFNYLKRMDFAPLPDIARLPMLGTRSRE
jgi:N-acetylglucosaminyldiphosphoundecaprenol N-acetyl-beta-D-mannosaminyltransferase